MRFLSKSLFLAIGLMAFGALVYFAWAQRDAFLGFDFFSADFVIRFLLSAIFFSAIYPVSGIAYHLLVRHKSPSSTWILQTKIVSVGQLARYLPGNIAQLIARGAMLKAQSVPMLLIASSMVLETSLTIVAASFLSLLGLLTFGFQLPSSLDFSAKSLLVLSACSVALLLLISFKSIRNYWLRQVLSLLDGLTISILAKILVLYLINFFLVGVGFTILGGFFGVPLAQVLYMSTAFSLAWVIGSVIPGPPAGLGVRELVLFSLLYRVIPHDSAVVLVSMHRLSTLLSDAVVGCAACLAYFKNDLR
ncbi:lysylphosphatidylglycerol synthase domain-containing protein [Xanthomonas sp. A1809]|uniref:lysylphosphatidylglycerol synthase domain-containing protein n=2 Tax=Xanthomonas TaxID=338 RepID=UPI001482B155|nr:lysylphosphatidylglycerol synthase domain-containing protein [Xanthomonas sp. A1809]MBO9856870.1 flippase-like domain-containing protein [Xanthomonas sp. A1809]